VSLARGLRRVSGELRRLNNAAPIVTIRRLASEARGFEATPPYDPRQAAERLGLRVDFRSVEAKGLLESEDPKEGRILIGLTADRRPPTIERQNFLVAHELGHFLLRGELHKRVPPDFFATESPDEEWLCNQFAAEFLMPANGFGAALRRAPGDPESLLALCKRHSVSIKAGVIRAYELTRLWDKSFVAVFWKCSGSNLTKEWSVPGDGVTFCGDTSLISDASKSNMETAGYRLVTLKGEKRRLWCRTVSLLREETFARNQYRDHYLLTLCVHKEQ